MKMTDCRDTRDEKSRPREGCGDQLLRLDQLTVEASVFGGGQRFLDDELVCSGEALDVDSWKSAELIIVVVGLELGLDDECILIGCEFISDLEVRRVSAVSELPHKRRLRAHVGEPRVLSDLVDRSRAEPLVTV
jgi:hypothetical protein